MSHDGPWTITVRGTRGPRLRGPATGARRRRGQRRRRRNPFDMPFPVRLRLFGLSVLAGLAFAGSIFASASAAGDEAVTLAAPPGILQGTLTLPAGAGPFPVVMILAGSGPTDRDGNSPRRSRPKASRRCAMTSAAAPGPRSRSARRATYASARTSTTPSRGSANCARTSVSIASSSSATAKVR